MYIRMLFELWLIIKLVKFIKVRLKLLLVCKKYKLKYKTELKNIKKSYMVADLDQLANLTRNYELSKRQAQDVVIFTHRYNKSTNYKIKVNTYLMNLGKLDKYRCDNLTIAAILELYNKVKK